MILKDKSRKIVNEDGIILYEGNKKEIFALVKKLRKDMGMNVSIWMSYTHNVGDNINDGKRI